MERPRRPAPRRATHPCLLLSILLTAGMLCLLDGCSQPAGEGGPESDGEAATGEASAPEATVYEYRIRAQVVEIPDPEDPLSGFFVHHEAVGDFRDMDGNVVGMDSMTMPFAVAEELSLEGIAVGDKVTFTLTVDWDADPAYQVTSIERLDPATELVFGNAAADEGGGDNGGEH